MTSTFAMSAPPFHDSSTAAAFPSEDDNALSGTLKRRPSLTPNGQTHLSPYTPPNHNSGITSPTFDDTNTPADSISTFNSHLQTSEYSELGDSDPFFGVDFSNTEGGTPFFMGEEILPASRTDSFENPTDSAIRGNQGQPKPGESPADSSYPLSPGQTASIHTASPSSDQRAFARPQNGHLPLSVSPKDLHMPYKPVPEPYAAPVHPAPELTPDPSRSGRSSEDGLAPQPTAMLPAPCRSPLVTVSMWGKDGAPVQSLQRTFTLDDDDDAGASSGGLDAAGDLMYSPNQAPFMPPPPPPKDDIIVRHRTPSLSRRGLEPGSRPSTEVSSVNEMVTRREIEERNQGVDKWLSDNLVQSPPQEFTPQNNSAAQNESFFSADTADDGIPMGNHTQNQHKDGQLYIMPEADGVDQTDLDMLHMNHRWGDAPMTHSITDQDGRRYQPETSHAAMARFNRMCDNESIVSKAATWGTRRRSLPSLVDLDIENITSGRLLKKLSINREKDRTNRRPSLLKDLRGLVRRPSASQLLKRAMSHHEDEASSSNENLPVPEKRESFPHLAPPSRSGSWGSKKAPVPSINTALVSMGGSFASIGTTHARSGSISANSNTSPKSPFTGLQVKNKLQRPRSKSDLPKSPVSGGSHSNLADMWRRTGGPPVATLGTAVNLEPEDDDDDEDDLYEDGDMKADSSKLIDEITPNLSGFREHILRLNPNLNSHGTFLVDRIAHQQTIRYKSLLNLKMKHLRLGANCQCGSLCIALGGSANLLPSKGDSKAFDALPSQFDLEDEGATPIDGAITQESFPQDIPLPPTQHLPAEFECQLCFQSKKFTKPSDWTKHVHEDVQPFTCTWERCRDPKIFKRKADWVRHENEGHRHLEWWTCDVDDCRHTCYRRDNFLQHLVREHKFTEPKVKTKAALKRAGAADPIWQKVEKCHRDTEVKPQNEPCRFCGKTFPSWKKLTVHLAKHMEQISLPVLRLVETTELDLDTIISPVQDPPPRSIFSMAAPGNAHQPLVRDQAHFGQYPQPGYPPHHGPNPAGLMSGQPALNPNNPYVYPMTGLAHYQDGLLSSPFGDPSSALSSSPPSARGYPPQQTYQNLPVSAAPYVGAQQPQYVSMPQNLEPFPTLDQTSLGLQQTMPYEMYMGQDTMTNSGYASHASNSPYTRSPQQGAGGFYPPQ